MTRGRAPNLALPLTKALAQQRDYRARKAANIARLEKENDTLRSENEQLAKELAILRDVHHRGHADSRLPTPSSSSAEATAQTQADYQHLRTSYHALEAEVRRKEHVLHVLREKEREAFARLEGLLKQSLEVVDGARVTKEEWTGSDPRRTFKGEALQTVSDLHLAPHPDLYRPDSVVSSARSYSSREFQAQPRMPVEPDHARLISPSVSRAHGELSSSPDIDSYRARKRVRSSPPSNMAYAAPQHAVALPPVQGVGPESNRSRYISQQSYLAGQSAVGHASPHGYASHLPLHPRPLAIRELPPPRLSPFAGGNAPFSTHSQISSSPGSAAFKGDYPHHILPLSTPPATSYFREEELRPPVSFLHSESRQNETMHRPPSTASDMADQRGESWKQEGRHFETMPRPQDTSIPAPSPTPNAMAGADPSMQTTMPLPELSREPVGPTEWLPLSSTAVGREEQRQCGQTTKCTPSQCPPRISKAEPTPAQHESPLAPRRIETSATQFAATTDSTEAVPREVSPTTLPEANCCNGLFDCSSLPPSLWMPLHAMSTSYERGNQPSKTAFEAVETPEPALAFRTSESAAPSSSGNAHDDVKVTPEVASSVARAQEQSEGQSIIKETDDECCFGILRCEDGAT